VAGRAPLFEEFLAREARAGRLQPALKAARQKMLVHGHCHQKAFAAVQPVLEVVRLIPSAEPTLIESSCCGMGGSFGYEARYQPVSMQMAELSLLPAVRAATAALIVAGAGRVALHVAHVLADHLARTCRAV
jgi:Fe-S oxidoreductase